MLSSEVISKILGSPLPSFSFKDIHWRFQDSDSGSILFYKVAQDQKSEDLFHSRITNTKYAHLIVNRKLNHMPANTTVVDESQWPKFQHEILNHFYPLPPLKLIGITGTNGKTTTADLILQLGHLIGKNGLSIGTLGVREYGKTLLDFGLTSPSLIDLRKFLSTFGQNKDFCVMEASSHALIQDRLHGINFDVAGWTSFSQDHLDYHKNMDEYFKAKALIFEKVRESGVLFVPMEQEDLFKKLKKTSSKAHVAPEINEDLPVFFKTVFNKNNLEVAKACIEKIFGDMTDVDYKKILPPDGRFYIRPYKSNYIVVDFAHTPDALENICAGIKETFPGYKLKVLFGCGGDRDRTKRPLMAAVVAKWADEIYVTSDNPRSENPDQIISDILKGVKETPYQAITERPKAVRAAFLELKEKEVLLLAGKGHEDYILINDIKHPYSDIKEVDEFIERMGK